MLDYSNFFVGLILSAAPVTALYIYLRNDFERREVRADVNSPSSFFQLNELVVDKNLSFYANAYGAVIGVVLWLSFAFCCGSADLSRRLIALLDDVSSTFASMPWLSKIASDFNYPPVSLLALVVIVAIVFAPHLRIAANLTKGVVQTGIGIDETCDRLVARSVEDVRQAVGYAKGLTLFAEGATRPRELKDADDRPVLQYFLLDSVVGDVPRDGLIVALRRKLNENGIASSLHADPPALLTVVSLTTPIVFFSAATLMFAFLLPLFGNWICGDGQVCKLWPFGLCDFPDYLIGRDHKAVICDLLLLCCQVSLQIVIPLWFGLLMSARRKQSASNIAEANFSSVAGLQIIFSLLMGTFYSLVNHVYGQGRGGDLSFLSVERAFDACAPCIVAPVGLYVWRRFEAAKKFATLVNAAKICAVSLVCGIAYGVVGFGYSILANDNNLFPQGFAVSSFLTAVCAIFWLARGSGEKNRQPALVRPA